MVKVTRRPIKTEIESASYLLNGKAYALQTWSRGASDTRWPVRRTTRTKSPINTKIGRKVAHHTGNNAHQFQSQKTKRQGHQAN